MSNSNLLQGYTWDTQYDDPQQQFPRPIQDEVISVYEVYVKEETVGADGRSDISIVSGEPGISGQLMQGTECLDLDAAIGSEVINVDGSITKLLQGKDTVKYKILQEQNVNDESVVVYSHPMSESGPSTTRLVDKDDPRSRLHFVKYLKRDGKTLKIWECGICSKEFRHQYTLMRHLPTHTDERNFKCEACGKAFRQLSTLSQHRAIHSDARPYVCEFCKKTFNRVSTLISHRKTHSEHKPHKCHLCGKGFHQKGNLRNHVFTHTNERPYKCETCGKGFNQMSNLMCHKVKAHAHAEKMQYVCAICGKEFPRRFSLRSHEEYKHGIKYRHPNAPVVLQDVNEDSGITKNKNVSIVSLPSGERPMISDAGCDKENLNLAGLYAGNVIVDKIDTKAMENAVMEGQTPFALFKPVKGIPVLVKVANAASNDRKQMLTPATAEDLRMAGKMSLSPTLGDGDGVKAVQIKVPVVATVTQRIEPDGSYSFLIEPPGPGQEQESLIEPISQYSCLEQRPQAHISDNLRSCTEVERNSQDQMNSGSGSAEDCSDLLELAAQGGIQFVRATEDGRYEVMTNSEARDLMAQNSHDVTILDGEEAEALSVVNLRGNNRHRENIQGQEIIIDGDSNSQITVLNSGSNSMIHQQKINSLTPIDGIEILGEKDIRILENHKELDGREETEEHRSAFNQNGITVFDQERMDEFVLGPENLHGHQSLASVLDQNPMKNSQPMLSSFFQKNQAGVSVLNNSFHGMKHHPFNDGISPSQAMELASKLRLSDYEMCDLSGPNVAKQEVKILGARNHNKVKILGRSMDKTEIEKVLQLGNTPSMTNNKVKILGSKNAALNQYKDVKILGSTNIKSESDAKEEVKILGMKRETQGPGFRPQASPSGFEVRSSVVERARSCVPETIVIEDSPAVELNSLIPIEESESSYKSADFIQESYRRNAGDRIDIENILGNTDSIRDVEMRHFNGLINESEMSSSDDDLDIKDGKISEVTSISERDFEIIGHCQAIGYNSLPDLD